MSTIAILTAGGIGTRTYQDIPKQFLLHKKCLISLNFYKSQKIYRG